MSVNGFPVHRGVQPLVQTGDAEMQVPVGTTKTTFIDTNVGRSGTVYGMQSFIYFVFTCIAVAQSDTDAINSACGSTLRYIVIGDMIVSLFLNFVLTGIFQCLKCLQFDQFDFNENAFNIISKLICIVCFIVMSYYTARESFTAFRNPACLNAMSSMDGGKDSPSGFIGSPLLAEMGYMYVVGFSCWAFYFLLSLCSCASN
jgi:hypothetical protein